MTQRRQLSLSMASPGGMTGHCLPTDNKKVFLKRGTKFQLSIVGRQMAEAIAVRNETTALLSCESRERIGVAGTVYGVV